MELLPQKADCQMPGFEEKSMQMILSASHQKALTWHFFQ
jgi:hypothetical protein